MAHINVDADAGGVLARLHGREFRDFPEDLYIPAFALEVFLASFEGPLDFLLYLLRRNNIEISEVDVLAVANQYIAYIEQLDRSQFELAGDYLVMAALLAEMKSRTLLPRPQSEEQEEDDPRAELIRRLQEYDIYRRAAFDLDRLDRLERDVFLCAPAAPEKAPPPLPEANFSDLLEALSGALARVQHSGRLRIRTETLSVRERMTALIGRLQGAGRHLSLEELLVPHEGRIGVVVTFVALLELARSHLIELMQNSEMAPIYVRVKKA
ncbi:MAG: segregation/condensation protein A [Gammaproteobacteria bacterium AqS3]|nr:segregation/condensation protein A [Gammaproteobacteria bacterium AqS3]